MKDNCTDEPDSIKLSSDRLEEESKEGLVVPITQEDAPNAYRDIQEGKNTHIKINSNALHFYEPQITELATAEGIEALHQLNPEFSASIIKMMEKDQDALIYADNEKLSCDKERLSYNRIGLWGGMILSVIFGIFSLLSLGMGSENNALVFSGAIVAMLSILVLGKTLKSKAPNEDDE